MKTQLTLISPNQKILYSQEIGLYKLNKNNLNSWEVADFGDLLEQKIERFLVKGGVQIGGDRLKEYGLLHTIKSDIPTLSCNEVNKNTWQTNSKEHFYLIQHHENTIFVTDHLGSDSGTIYNRIQGEGLNALWISDNNELIYTEKTLTIKINFLGEKIMSKYMRFPLFSTKVLDNLKDYLYIKNGDKESYGWEFLTWYLNPLLNKFHSSRNNFDSNRFKSLDGREKAAQNVDYIFDY